jgi:myosin heavy subunit
MSNETSNNASKISIVVLVIALIGSWIYFVNTNNTKTEIITNYTAEVAVLDSTKNSIQADFIAASAKVDSLNQENTGLQGELQEKSVAIQKLKMNISNILRKKAATDKELEEAKSMISELNGKVNNLLTDLGKAQEENKQLNAQNQELTTQNSTLSSNLNTTKKEKERLQDIGSTLHASTFTIQAIRVKGNGSERATASAKRANLIRLAFMIDKNKITPSGNQELYVCITGPDGKAIGDGGNFNTREDGARTYANKLSVVYEQNVALPVSYDFKQSNKFTEGAYKVEVYHNGFKIGEGKTELKKSLF